MIVTHCPRCDEAFRVPDAEFPDDAYAECPWCRESFPLAEVTHRLPPILQVMSADGQLLGMPQPAAALSSVGGFESDGTRSSSESGLQLAGDADDGITTLADDAAALDAIGDLDDSEHKTVSEDTVAETLNESSIEDSTADFAVEDPNDTWEDERQPQSVSPMKVTAAPVLTRRSQGSPVRTVLSIVLGGLAAGPLAVLILWVLTLFGVDVNLGFWPLDGNSTAVNNDSVAAAPADVSRRRSDRPELSEDRPSLSRDDGFDFSMPQDSDQDATDSDTVDSLGDPAEQAAEQFQPAENLDADSGFSLDGTTLSEAGGRASDHGSADEPQTAPGILDDAADAANDDATSLDDVFAENPQQDMAADRESERSPLSEWDPDELSNIMQLEDLPDDADDDGSRSRRGDDENVADDAGGAAIDPTTIADAVEDAAEDSGFPFEEVAGDSLDAEVSDDRASDENSTEDRSAAAMTRRSNDPSVGGNASANNADTTIESDPDAEVVAEVPVEPESNEVAGDQPDDSAPEFNRPPAVTETTDPATDSSREEPEELRRVIRRASGLVQQLDQVDRSDAAATKDLQRDSYIAIAAVAATADRESTSLQDLLQRIKSSQDLELWSNNAIKWIELGSRRPSDGVLLVGTIRAGNDGGRVELTTGQSIQLTDDSISLRPSAQVIALGQIVQAEPEPTIKLIAAEPAR